MSNFSQLINKYFSHDLGNDVAAIFYKDTAHRYQYVNDNLLGVMKYYIGEEFTADELIGKTDGDIYPKSMAKFFINFDIDVIQAKIPITRFQCFKIDSKRLIHAVATKIPIFDKDNHVIGILGKTRYLNFFKIGGELVILSNRELDILAHVVFGLSFKTIARNLDISVGTVSTYLLRLKDKIGCQTQVEIIELIRKHALSAHVLEYLCRLFDQKH